ncbi:MAG: hypothetical protein R2710_04675 [Acidimicrobiales bacterium]
MSKPAANLPNKAETIAITARLHATNDTGSPEVQIALGDGSDQPPTAREGAQEGPPSAVVALLMLVGQRRRARLPRRHRRRALPGADRRTRPAPLILARSSTTRFLGRATRVSLGRWPCARPIRVFPTRTR